MTYENRYRTAVIMTTIFFMYGLIIWLEPILKTTIPLPVGLLTSIGLYQLLATIFQALFARLKWARKLFAGVEYLEGTWVGILGENNKSNELQLFVEYYRQTPTNLNITGHSYTLEDEKVADWYSTSSYFDPANRRLFFSYLSNDINENKTWEGIAVLNALGLTQSTSPNTLNGYSTDIPDGIRITTKQEKFSDELVGIDSALKEAKKRFTKNIPNK